MSWSLLLRENIYGLLWTIIVIIWLAIRNSSRRDRWAASLLVVPVLLFITNIVISFDGFSQSFNVADCVGYPLVDCGCAHSRNDNINCAVYASTTTLNWIATYASLALFSLHVFVSAGASWVFGGKRSFSAYYLIFILPYLLYSIVITILGIVFWGNTRLSEEGRILYGGVNIPPELVMIHVVLFTAPFIFVTNNLSKFMWFLIVFLSAIVSYAFGDAFGSYFNLILLSFSIVMLLDPLFYSFYGFLPIGHEHIKTQVTATAAAKKTSTKKYKLGYFWRVLTGQRYNEHIYYNDKDPQHPRNLQYKPTGNFRVLVRKVPNYDYGSSSSSSSPSQNKTLKQCTPTVNNSYQTNYNTNYGKKNNFLDNKFKQPTNNDIGHEHHQLRQDLDYNNNQRYNNNKGGSRQFYNKGSNNRQQSMNATNKRKNGNVNSGNNRRSVY